MEEKNTGDEVTGEKVTGEKVETKSVIVPLTPAVTLAPTTTQQQDITTEGQRKVNLIWENTQKYIAMMVITVGMLVNSIVIVSILFFTSSDVTINQLAIISIGLQFINLTAGIVIGFYFSRTNHSKIGGVGNKEGER